MFIKSHKVVSIYGWYGAVAIITAYFLINFSFVGAKDFWYLFLNITGAVGILMDSLYHKAYQSATVNIVWIAIGLFSILNIIK